MARSANSTLRRSVFFPVVAVIFSIQVFMFSAFADSVVTVPAYEKFETSFPVAIPYENPFDAADVQVDASVQRENDPLLIIPCFNDGDIWKLRFTPVQPGTYTYQIQAKTAKASVEAASGTFQVTAKEDRGFIRIGQSHRHFVFDDGESYFPLGENLGWVHFDESNPLQPWIGYLDECQQAGMNWIRIWMCSWGETELTWIPNGVRYSGYQKYDLQNARTIDGIFQEAEKRGIYIQWVINHHGQYSSDTNPLWNENPFNAANGGFLKNPEDFFTDAQAKQDYRNRLRYLVARWGYSTHLLAWEFWNEVDLTSHYIFPTVKQWHEEMSAYLRGLDPYQHLHTTSGSGDFKNLHTIESMDYLQTHAYTSNLIGTLAAVSRQRVQDYPQKPHLVGEMAYSWQGPAQVDPTGVSLHNQLWASVHATEDAGTAMTWWWDSWIRPKNLYSHFRILADYLHGIDWDRENLRPMKAQIDLQEENLGTLYFVPLKGWGKSQRSQFAIQEDGTVEGQPELSEFVHGQGHRDLAPNPSFPLELKKTSSFELRIDRVSKNGAECQVKLDGQEILQRVFASAKNDSTMGPEGRITVSIPAGRHTISIENNGPDWFHVQYYRVDGIAPRPVAYARGNQDHILVWIYDRTHQLAYLAGDSDPQPLVPSTLILPEILKGEFAVEPFDPYTGQAGAVMTRSATGEGLQIPIPSFTKDTALRIRQKKTAVETPLR